jgi:hypothetical protein
MSSPRLEGEDYEAYKKRMRQEAFDREELLAGEVVVASSLANRRMVRSIPNDAAIVIAKMSELGEEFLPLKALQMLYLTTPTSERKEMIDRFKIEIENFDKLEIAK